ncbi:MAG: hypothetical protein V3T41_11150, partial [bacterium]
MLRGSFLIRVFSGTVMLLPVLANADICPIQPFAVSTDLYPYREGIDSDTKIRVGDELYPAYYVDTVRLKSQKLTVALIAPETVEVESEYTFDILEETPPVYCAYLFDAGILSLGGDLGPCTPRLDNFAVVVRGRELRNDEMRLERSTTELHGEHYSS